jgi:hypothetical protein
MLLNRQRDSRGELIAQQRYPVHLGTGGAREVVGPGVSAAPPCSLRGCLVAMTDRISTVSVLPPAQRIFRQHQAVPRRADAECEGVAGRGEGARRS